MSVTFYLPDPLQDVGGEGGHPRRTTRELHQHGEQLEERVGRLTEGDDRVLVCFFGALNEADVRKSFVLPQESAWRWT